MFLLVPICLIIVCVPLAPSNIRACFSKMLKSFAPRHVSSMILSAYSLQLPSSIFFFLLEFRCSYFSSALDADSLFGTLSKSFFFSPAAASKIFFAASWQHSGIAFERESISEYFPEYTFFQIFWVSFSKICCVIFFIETLFIFIESFE